MISKHFEFFYSSTSGPPVITEHPADKMDTTPALIRPEDVPSCSSISLSEPLEDIEEPHIHDYQPSPDPSILDVTPTQDEDDVNPTPEIHHASYELLEEEGKVSESKVKYDPESSLPEDSGRPEDKKN